MNTIIGTVIEFDEGTQQATLQTTTGQTHRLDTASAQPPFSVHLVGLEIAATCRTHSTVVTALTLSDTGVAQLSRRAVEHLLARIVARQPLTLEEQRHLLVVIGAEASAYADAINAAALAIVYADDPAAASADGYARSVAKERDEMREQA